MRLSGLIGQRAERPADTWTWSNASPAPRDHRQRLPPCGRNGHGCAPRLAPARVAAHSHRSPLMRNVLTDLVVENEARALPLVMRIAQAAPTVPKRIRAAESVFLRLRASPLASTGPANAPRTMPHRRWKPGGSGTCR